MFGLLCLLLFAAIGGWIYPYIKGAKRWHFAVATVVLFIALVVASPTPTETSSKTMPAPAKTMPDKPTLTLDARPLDANRVELTIGTNLPMPIKVSTSIDLQGQKDTDSYIGYSEFVELKGEKTVVVLDTSKDGKKLPAANYDAIVKFFPRWGAEGNPAASKVPELTAQKAIKLSGSGGTAANAALTNDRQRWVMETVVSGLPWSKAKFDAKLGKSERGRSDISHLHDAYYYPGADMTILVNRLKNEVTTFRKGNAIVPPNATKAEFEARGLKWPLTVASGYLGCEGSAVWFSTLDGVTYGVNGAASQYKDIKPIWASDEKMMRELRAAGAGSGPQVKINIGDLIDEGRKLCS